MNLRQNNLIMILNFQRISLLFISFLMICAGSIKADSTSSLDSDKIRNKIIAQLVKDGYAEKNQTKHYFFVFADYIATNGEELEGEKFQKYISFLLSIGVKIESNWGFFKTKKDEWFYGVARRGAIDEMIRKYHKSETSNEEEDCNSRSKKHYSFNFDGPIDFMGNFWKALNKELVRDKLARKDGSLQISISNDVWKINGKTLSKKISDKYLNLLLDQGVKFSTEQFTFYHTGDKNWNVKGSIDIDIN